METNEKIASLAKMTVGQLKDKHVELFGEPTRSSNRQWLYRRLAWRVQSMAEGGLSQRARDRARELVREVDIRLRPPKELKMPPATGHRVNGGTFKVQHDDRLPMPGAILTRKFKGHTYYVTVLTNGFEFDGEVYRTLSAVANKITGHHWNGYQFFNLNRSKR